MDSGLPSGPVTAPPACVGSKLVVLTRDKSDLEGRADCENGVVGEARLAEVLVAPSTP